MFFSTHYNEGDRILFYFEKHWDLNINAVIKNIRDAN